MRITLAVVLAIGAAGACTDDPDPPGEGFYIPTTPTPPPAPEEPSGAGCMVLEREYTWFTEGDGSVAVTPEWDLLLQNACGFDVHVHAKAVAFDRATGSDIGFGASSASYENRYRAGQVAWICENKNPGDGVGGSCQFIGTAGVLTATLHWRDPVDVRFTWASCNPERSFDCPNEPPDPE